MKKTGSVAVYLCSNCGTDYPKWLGQCPSCNEWGTLSEYKVSKSKQGSKNRTPSKSTPLTDILQKKQTKRIPTHIAEVDRVLGGGILPGSLILLGGNPGIGKSTLALQMLGKVNRPSLYISAEESEDQIAMRAKRLQISSSEMQLSGENHVDNILEQIISLKPEVVIIDSIQTVYSDSIDSLPGSVSQIRESGQQLLQICKERGVTIVLIGHVTKEGIIAGPRMLEHMVDTVLYLEGDDRYDHRILRSVKNRFGATNEVGIFQMQSDGLIEVENPSELFLAERSVNVAGSAIFPSLEGTRPILVEVQALVSNANFGTPQRNVNGIDLRRLSMLLAVFEKRLKLPMGTRDTFVNLVGGLRIDDPAADLAVIGAIASSALEKPIPQNMILIGEVGLAGEVRSVSQLEKRLIESQTLGFESAIVPKYGFKKANQTSENMKYYQVDSVKKAFEIIFP
ncbi:MAG: DNA repair protein RadA [Candidatus Marinimicrobia bacterium]|nr:DNA repair protein RadA [Candidatus Neomarinimicrobiota bacterium]